MMGEADELFPGLEEVLDVLEDGLLLGRGRGVEPLKQDPTTLRLGQALRHHLLGVALHVAPVPIKEEQAPRALETSLGKLNKT